MEQLKTISQTDLTGKLHVGQDDSPALGTLGMQQLFDAHPNVNTDIINQNATTQNANNADLDTRTVSNTNDIAAHIGNTSNPHVVTKPQIGLGNVDNTSDANKPVSTAQQAAHDNLKDYIDNIALKAGAVTSFNGRAGAILPQDGDYTLPQVGGSRKNMVALNADSRTLVNQQAQNSYTAGSTFAYSLDGIKIREGTLTVNDGFVNFVSTGAGTYAPRFQTPIETKLEAGKTYTISALVRVNSKNDQNLHFRLSDSGGTWIEPSNMVLDVTTDFKVVSKTFVCPSNYENPNIEFIGGNSAAVFNVDRIAWKLEKGEGQTLARQDANSDQVLNDPPPNPQQELAKCQRYQLFAYGDLARALIVGTTTIFFFIPTPITMRDKPIINTGDFKIRSISGVDQTGFTFDIISARSNGIFMSAQKTSHGLNDAIISLNNIIFDANIY